MKTNCVPNATKLSRITMPGAEFTWTSPGHGTLSGAAPNFTYTPVNGFSGSDRFAFVANDGQVNSAPGIVTT